MRFTLFAILIFIITRGGLVGQPNAMVLSGATLYDGTGNSITNAIIVIKDGRLSAVGDRFTPVPVLAEASVLFAGMSKMNFRRFLIISTLSNLGISIVYAAVGAYSVSENSFLLAFAGAIIIPAVAKGVEVLYRKLA